MDNTSNRTVLITGTSTGIGRACALYMQKLGWRVFAGVRKETDAASLRAKRVESSGRLTPLFLDVTDSKSVKEAAHLVAREVGKNGLSGLVNNAGIPYGGPVEYLDVDKVRAEFEVNFFGALSVTQTFLPLLRLGKGRVINISSISGLVSMPFVSSYSSTKFALEALSDSLRVELSPWGMQVSVIEPGAIATPIWSKAGEVMKDLIGSGPQEGLDLYGGLIGPMQSRFKLHGLPPDEVARAVAHALTSRRARTRYTVGVDGKIYLLLKHLPDRLRDWLIKSQLPEWGQKK
jgi:NAD(P)-dependent dehydrogenase (short-subunit alcohol dehydrogenase family)